MRMQLAAIIAILKAARQMGLIDDIGRISTAGEEPVDMPGATFSTVPSVMPLRSCRQT